MRRKGLAVWFAIGIAGAVPAGCGGGSSAVPTAPPPPSGITPAVVSGGQFVASGSTIAIYTTGRPPP